MPPSHPATSRPARRTVIAAMGALAVGLGGASAVGADELRPGVLRPVGRGTIQSAPGNTAAVLDHHLRAFMERDVDEIMRNYTEESVLIIPDGIARGLGQIRAVFVDSFDLFTAGFTMTLHRRVVEGEVAYIFWSATSSKVDVSLATDTFVVRGGKIVVQTFAAQLNPRSA